MNPEAYTALRHSIAHWERMRDGATRDQEMPAHRHCALCQEFLEAEGCAGCPVSDKTGRDFCSGTPYSTAAKVWNEFGSSSDAFRPAAQAQVDFLKSLLSTEASMIHTQEITAPRWLSVLLQAVRRAVHRRRLRRAHAKRWKL